MGIDAWIAVACVVGVFAALIFTRIGADLAMICALALLLVTGVLKPGEALSGFSNPGMITVGVLFVVAAGVRETGALTALVRYTLGQPRSVTQAQLRLMIPVAGLSGFLNNTPLVAMLMPVVDDWARNRRLPASKLLIPLSYAAILGGTCTLVGTSTNLVVSGLLTSSGRPPFGMFELALVGIPCTIAGLLYVAVFSRWLLANRKPAISPQDDPRKYVTEMVVENGSPLSGKTIEAAGLRHLPGLYLCEVERNGDILAAVRPDLVLHDRDRLVFSGPVESVVDLNQIRGLRPARETHFDIQGHRSERTLVEAVVSDTSPLVGRTINQGHFRTHYNAAVLAVARNGHRLDCGLGGLVLRPGDALLLETPPDYVAELRVSLDFYLVSTLGGAWLPRHERANVAIAILLGMVAVVTLGWLSMLEAGLLAAIAMLASRCTSAARARSSIDHRVLLTIAASFGLGQALNVSGAAQWIAHSMLSLHDGRPILALALVYLLAVVFTELITNNAAAVLVFPIAAETAASLGANFMPFVIAITIGASASFATPIGYQTNLMVYGPGGYRFTDFMRFGLPLTVIVGAISMLVVPVFWPL